MDVNGPEEEPEPEMLSGSIAGAAVLTVASGGVGFAVFAYSRDAFVLLVWALGAAAVWYAAKKPVPSTPNPAPPPPPEGVEVEEPQVSVVRDPSHPNRWLTIRPSRWLREDNTKETGTS